MPGDILTDDSKMEFGQGGDPVVTPKDLENKDGMLAKPSSMLPRGAARGGEFVGGSRLGSEHGGGKNTSPKR